MKKTLTLLVCSLLLIVLRISAQDFMGYSMSNYSGITGAYLNPASIADSRFKFDMELIGADISFANNYLGFSKQLIKGNNNNGNNNNNGPFNDITERMNGDNKSMFLNASIHLPSFMIRINPKNSIGFIARNRTYLNVDGLEPNLAHQIYKGLQDSAQYAQTLDNKNLSLQFMSWTEYGVTFAHVFKDDGKHFLKAGATLKLLQGLGAFYMNIKDLHYSVSNKDTIAVFNTSASYGHSTNLAPPVDPSNPKLTLAALFQNIYSNQVHPSASSFGFGGDIGVVYEYRPNYQKFKYDMDGETNLDMRWKNKYKFKFGLSVNDLGGIKYAKAPDSHDFTANVNLWDIAKFAPPNLAAFDDSIKKRFVEKQSDKSFYMVLPSNLSFQADYNVYKDFYAGLMGMYAFQFNTANQVHEISKIAFVPRWDQRWFGVFVPVSYDGYRNLNYGVNIRLGPVIFGSNAINSYFGQSNIFGGEFHVLFKIPIPYHGVKDRDHDKVSDKKDKCPDVPGTWEFSGCPDRDGDHVPDSEDQCPDVPGKKELHGCPDRDGDGIPDQLDACPDVPGLPQFNGCPDRDGDGVPDKDDECPDQPGPKELHGCPDRDGDGVPDKVDLCPDKPGPVDNNGCPVATLIVMDKSGKVLQKVQRSKDGSFNFETLPNEENSIFSVEGDDTQNLNELKITSNGITKKLVRGADHYFRFEQIKMDQNKLSELDATDVPIKLTKEEAQVLKKAFSNLEFETGKDVIKSESFASLDELAALLKKKPEWKLKLSGFTDNQGKKEDNMKLSENRARAVAKHLMDKGIDEKRFKILWFGPDKPIAPNTTPQGRQKNRRVEMVIID
jgi:outer membrane protein OmpA-like peptidoglycan-associated protein